MPRKPKNDPKLLPPISVRISEVRDRVYDGNAKEMARDLKIPYLSLMRTLKGADPSSRLLTALVLRAAADARWLLTGRAIRARDFGLSANVKLLAICPQFLPARTIGDLIPDDWERQPVVSTRPIREAYCYSISARDELLAEQEVQVATGDLLIIECADDEGPDDSRKWSGAWVTFRARPDSSRVRVGFLNKKKLIRGAGDDQPRFRVGPDPEFGRSSGLFKPRTTSATRYGIEADGITTIYSDDVLGRVVAKICWRGEFQSVEPVATPA